MTPPPSPPVSEEGPPRELTSEEIAQLKQRIEDLAGQLKRYTKARRKSAPKTPATEPHVGLLPLEFAAFGDIYYQILEPGADDFVVGNVELDPTFHLSDYVAVSAALAFSGANQNLSLAAFVVDCGLLGEGEGFPVQSSVVSRSGVSFGQFDVPFGVAYLEYPSVSNRLMRVPQAVSGTYASWNDVGVQGYAEAEHWTLITYVVNGSQFETDLADSSKPRVGAGGRGSTRFADAVELGGSYAELFGFNDRLYFAGGDASVVLGRLDVRSEYILKHERLVGALDDTHGIYSRAILDLDPIFLVSRYDTVFNAEDTTERRLTGGATIEVFKDAEIRGIFEHSLETGERTISFQLVGGSNFQPTGLRR